MAKNQATTPRTKRTVNRGAVSKSRIKRLRGLARPQYRLRVGEVRVFYDVVEAEVHVLAIVPKSLAAEWLSEWGTEE